MWVDDRILLQCHLPLALAVWCPLEASVVLGRSNLQASECYEEACQKEGVSILRRYGGGGAVVLHPACVVISLGLWVKNFYGNDYYFRQINQAVVASLADDWPILAELQLRGISDLAWGERKVAGTSMFRSRNYLLYQASLLVDSGIDLMERLLAHPSTEPSYRQRKSHREFVSGLNEIIPGISREQVKAGLEMRLPAYLKQGLCEDLLAPVNQQIPHLLQKAQTERMVCP